MDDQGKGAGWYVQPDGSQRYWDGSAWVGISVPPSTTDSLEPTAPAEPAREATEAVGAEQRPRRRPFWIIGALAFAVVVVLLAVAVNRLDGNGDALREDEASLGPTTVATPGTSPLASPTPTSSTFSMSVRLSQDQWDAKTPAEKRKTCGHFNSGYMPFRNGYLRTVGWDGSLSPTESWMGYDVVATTECGPSASAPRVGTVSPEFIAQAEAIDWQAVMPNGDFNLSTVCGYWLDPYSMPERERGLLFKKDPYRAILNYITAAMTIEYGRAPSTLEPDMVVSMHAVCGLPSPK